MDAFEKKIQSLIDYANETTGAGDTLLGDAVKTLVEGYGQGGGGVSDLGYNGHINTAQLAAQGWTQAQIDRLVSKIWWNEDEDEWYNSHIDKFYRITSSIKPPADSIAVTYDVANLSRLDYYVRSFYSICYIDITDVQSSGFTWCSQMCYRCYNLRVLILDPVSMPSPISTFQSAFTDCNNLMYIKIGASVKIANGLDCSSLLSAGYNLREVDWHTDSPVTLSGTAHSAFARCTRLSKIDFDSMGIVFSPSNATSTFASCFGLKSIVGVVDLSNTTAFPFVDCFRLEDVQIRGLKVAANISASPLSHDSLIYLLENLQTVSGLKLTLGATNLAKLSDAEKALATSKGWTLA